MSKELDSNAVWTLITIDFVPEFISGKCVLDMIQLVLGKNDFKFVVLNDIEGTGRYGLINELQEKINIVMELEDFTAILPEVNSFEWGDFFLFRESPIDWISPDENGYPNSVSKSDTTIRAVDTRYLYIYTCCKDLVDLISENYDIESIRTAPLNELDYPG